VFDEVNDAVDALLTDPAGVRDRLRAGNETHVAAARRNRELLQEFAATHGWPVPAWAT
jgi:hypothetical protein